MPLTLLIGVFLVWVSVVRFVCWIIVFVFDLAGLFVCYFLYLGLGLL